MEFGTADKFVLTFYYIYIYIGFCVSGNVSNKNHMIFSYTLYYIEF